MNFHRLIPMLSIGNMLITNMAVSTTAQAVAVTNAVNPKVESFPLTQVRLLDGPFKAAMDRDAKYLLEIDPERMLHNFRLNAKLPTTAQPLGNWEAPGSGIRGHLTGHYLSACSLMYASSGNIRFKERVDLMVSALAKCQYALGTNGYLSAFPETVFDDLETGKKPWAPYYTIHKIHAGLLDAYTLCGNTEALEIAKKLGDWITTRTGRLNEEQLQEVLNEEHGGINESMANLYALTGNSKYLQTARRLYHKSVLDPLSRQQDNLDGLHANTQIPKIIGTAKLYELTGEESYHTLTKFFWNRVVQHHSYAMGGNSDHEHFGAAGQLSERVSPFTAETCNTYNMLKLTRQVFSWDTKAEEADYYERALYNHILASQDPHSGMMSYHVPVYGGWFMPYNTPNDSAWCCTGTGFENHAKYGDSIYWHNADELYVNLFIPSEVTWKEKSITLKQKTRYPEEEGTHLELFCDKPVHFTLNIRYPGWADQGVKVKINGKPFKHEAAPASFISMERTWSSGDRVDVAIPMRLRLETMPDNASRAAICYGPIVLAGELGTNGITPPKPYAKSQGDFFNQTPPDMPVILAGKRPVSDWVKRVSDKPLRFKTKSVGKPRDITLVPFYQLQPQRYSLYWDLLTQEQWEARLMAEKQAAMRKQVLKERTVDEVKIGRGPSEREHNLQGVNMNSGSFSNRNFRDAANGGWFSYDFAVPTNQSVKLLCTYWGSDTGSREFSVLANEISLAHEKLNASHPGEFFDVEYELPPKALENQKIIRVKFQANPGNLAGGVYEVRLVKTASH